jgi:hypothetical protein
MVRTSTVAVLLTLLLVGCGGSSNSSNMMSPSSTPVISGTWSGSMTEHGGTVMGSSYMGGMMGGMMSGRMAWHLSQDGDRVTGSMDMSGFGGTGSMTMTGTVSGSTANLRMTIPSGGMHESGCQSDAQCTLQIDGSGARMTGTYSGTNSCSGAFSGGQITLAK